jgi:hypothetical protein
MFIVACLLQDYRGSDSTTPALVTFCPIARRTVIKSRGGSNYRKPADLVRVQPPPAISVVALVFIDTTASEAEAVVMAAPTVVEVDPRGRPVSNPANAPIRPP